MLDVSPWVLLIASLAFALGVTLQGSIGFGANLITSPIMFLLDPNLLPGPLLTAGLVMAAAFASRERGNGSWPQVGLMLTGRIPGAALGVVALGSLPVDGVGVLFGCLLLLAIGLSLSGWRVSPNPPTLLSAGFVSGFTATTIAVGGPPVAVVYQRSAGADVRANLSRILFLGTIASLSVLAIGGRYDLADALTGLTLLPAGALGYSISRRATSFFDRGYTRPALLGVSAATAVVVIIRSIV